MRRKRFLCQVEDLESADDSYLVAAPDEPGIGRVNLMELPPQAFQANGLDSQMELLTEGVVAAGARKKTGEESLKIEARSADNDGQMVALVDGSDGFQGVANKVSRRKLTMGLDHIDQMVGDRLAQIGRRFGRADIKAAVNLDGITTHDFAVETPGKMDSGEAFAHSGGTDEEDKITGFRRQFSSTG